MSNIPFSAAVHEPVLKRRIQGLKRALPDAWGNSPSTNIYAAFDVPNGKAQAFLALCEEMKLSAGWFGVAGYAHSGVNTYVIARFVKDPKTQVPKYVERTDA